MLEVRCTKLFTRFTLVNFVHRTPHIVHQKVVVIMVFVSLGLIALAVGPFFVARGQLPVAGI